MSEATELLKEVQESETALNQNNQVLKGLNNILGVLNILSYKDICNDIIPHRRYMRLNLCRYQYI